MNPETFTLLAHRIVGARRGWKARIARRLQISQGHLYALLRRDPIPPYHAAHIEEVAALEALRDRLDNVAKDARK